ncbi:general substrate transporter [Mollisia scopiformis]|uniref:General substrate transporter n=1 Tax=Mollisia scopiformis TaxID=149040 RepID=A0A194X948_MOLSC|nr:general substrate transporter [Mollisia scopiformis]KUJ16312.1 general substrate transporter [Mollisia scopiformis]
MEKDQTTAQVDREDVDRLAYSYEHITGLEVPLVTWWKHRGLRRLYVMMPILFLGSTTNGYDGSLLNGLQTMDPWQAYFNNPTGSKLGLITAIQQIGAICALFFSSYIADLFGRRIGVCTGLMMLFIGTILQVVPASNHLGMFLGGRFLVGFGSNLTQGSAPLLIMELAHPQHRGKLTTMYNTLWYMGAIIAAWTVFGTVKYTSNAAWRIPVGMQAAMPAIQMAFIFFVPESPRWLCSRDRQDEAFAILVKYHANGDTTDHFVKSEFQEIQETLRLEKVAANSGWTDFLKTPGNRKRLLLIALVSFFSQCSGNGLASYYLHDILNSVGITASYDQSLINGGLQIWSFLVAIFFSLLVDKMGRKLLFMIAGVGMLVTFSILTACSAVYAQSGNSGAGSAVIAMIFLFYGVAGFAWPGLTVAYCAEILPFNIRAKGMAINFALTATASVFNQYVNPIGLQHLAWKFYFVYIAILVIECLCIWFLFVETKGPTLEEIARLFDGDAANVSGKEVLDEKVAAAGRGHAEHIENA